jgi:hypothetical protein
MACLLVVRNLGRVAMSYCSCILDVCMVALFVVVCPDWPLFVLVLVQPLLFLYLVWAVVIL